jgi:hypothetical protein
MRTPKIEALQRLIDWLNAYSKNPRSRSSFPHIGFLPLDTSPLSSNAWLAGLIDADGSFSINYTINANALATAVKVYMRLSQRQEYNHRDTLGPTSYLMLLESIANLLATQANSFSRIHDSYLEEGILVVVKSLEARQALIAYLTAHPLLSSKYLDYLDWLAAHKLVVGKLTRTPEGTAELVKLKAGMNNSRTYYDWSHLEEFRDN